MRKVNEKDYMRKILYTTVYDTTNKSRSLLDNIACTLQY